jgi:cysteine-rich repeat protein
VQRSWQTVLAAALVGLSAVRPLEAATRYVDGACPTSGTGAQRACGAKGPVRTIREAIRIMHRGDTIQVAAGIYAGPFDLNGVRCGARARCTIRGAGRFETILRGMRVETDWRQTSPGVWVRTMQAAEDEGHGTENYPPRDDYDPGNVYQAGAWTADGHADHLPLGNAGDGVATPGDGQWSYDPATRRIHANPYGAAGPETLLVPFVFRLFDVRSARGYWTFEDLGLEGARAYVFDHHGPGTGSLTNLVFRNLNGGYVPRFMWLNPVPRIVIDGVRMVWLGRGMSAVVPPGQRSAYGIRIFHADGAVIRNVEARHLGGGRGFCGGACLPPWDDNTFSVTPVSGRLVDIKQTAGFTYEGGVLDDGPTQGALHLDASHDGTLSDVHFTRNATALVLAAQTPDRGRRSTYDIVAEDLTFAGNTTDVWIDTPATPRRRTLAIGARRDDGRPLATDPDPLPPEVVLLPTCGDREIRPPEECDDGNAVDGDGCDANCTRTRCGNEVVTTGEQCDDGNTRGGDCCDAACRVEPGGTACDDGEPCTRSDACAGGVCVGHALPAVGCRVAGSGAVLVRDGRGESPDRLAWRWKRGPATSPAELGDPVGGGTSYTLCVYDVGSERTRVLAGSTIPAGGQCGDAPCWRAVGRGFRYRRRTRSLPDRVYFDVRTDLRGRPRLALKRTGDFLSTGRLPAEQDLRVTVQLTNGSDVCWETTHVPPARRNDPDEFADTQD